MHSNLTPLRHIVVADSHTLTAFGIKYLLENKGIATVRSAHDKGDLFRLVNEETSLVIVDYLSVQNFNPIDLKNLRVEKPTVPVLVFTSDKNKQSIVQVLETGVNGFLFKDCLEDEIIRAVDSIIAGEKFFCNKVFDILLDMRQQKQAGATLSTALTSREVDIIKLVVGGQSTISIAEQLNLSPHTISTHRKNIIRKLKIKSPVELVTYAYDLGLLPAKSPM